MEYRIGDLMSKYELELDKIVKTILKESGIRGI